MQQILWETADNEISVQKCDVYLATALKKVNNRSILYIPFCFVAGGIFPTKIVLLVLCSIYIKSTSSCFFKLNSNILNLSCLFLLTNYRQHRNSNPATRG